MCDVSVGHLKYTTQCKSNKHAIFFPGNTVSGVSHLKIGYDIKS